MQTRPSLRKAHVILLWLAGILMPPLLQAEVNAVSAIGKVSTVKTVFINGSMQPSGRAILAGELISAQESPAYIALKNGGTVVLTQGAAAVFSKTGNEFCMRVEKGLVAFHFGPGDNIGIETKTHRFVAPKGNSYKTGEIEVGNGLHTRIALSAGNFSAYERSSGMRYSVNPSSADPTTLQMAGKGILTRGRNTLTDDAQNWTENLAGKCVRVGSEQHSIISNTPTRLTLDGAWKLNNGVYDYVIGECSAAAAKPSIKKAPTETKKGMGTGTKAAIGILAGGGAAAGIAAYLASKSGG